MENEPKGVTASNIPGGETSYKGEATPDNPDFIAALAIHYGIPVELVQQMFRTNENGLILGNAVTFDRGAQAQPEANSK